VCASVCGCPKLNFSWVYEQECVRVCVCGVCVCVCVYVCVCVCLWRCVSVFLCVTDLSQCNAT